MTDRKAFLLLLAVFCVLVAKGQSSTGSAYNIFGLGTLSAETIGGYKFLGNAGIGSRSSSMVNLKNPAALNAIYGPTQILDMDLAYKSLHQSSGTGTFATSLGGIEGINLWFKTGQRSGLSFGLKSFSDGRYDVTDQYVQSSIANSYSVRHQGTGGITSLSMAYGQSVTKNLSLGSTLSFVFGNLSKAESLSNNTYLNELTLEESNTVARLVADFGAQYSFRMFEAHQLTMGVTYRPAHDFNFKSTSKIIQQAEDSITSVSFNTVTLPQKLGAGLEYRTRKWAFSADAVFEGWGANGVSGLYAYQDQWKFASGIEFVKDRASMQYWDRLIWRAGGAFETNYLRVKNTRFANYQITAGVGLPVSHGMGILNMGYSYQAMGTTVGDMVLERTHTIRLNVSLRDIWFRKRVYD